MLYRVAKLLVAAPSRFTEISIRWSTIEQPELGFLYLFLHFIVHPFLAIVLSGRFACEINDLSRVSHLLFKKFICEYLHTKKCFSLLRGDSRHDYNSLLINENGLHPCSSSILHANILHLRYATITEPLHCVYKFDYDKYSGTFDLEDDNSPVGEVNRHKFYGRFFFEYSLFIGSPSFYYCYILWIQINVSLPKKHDICIRGIIPF